MRWCRYHHDGTVAFGLLDGQNVDEVDGSPFDGYIVTGVRRRLADIRLLTPCLPPTFYCAGLNYKAHIEWGERRRNIRIPIPHSDSRNHAQYFTGGDGLAVFCGQALYSATLW